MLTITGALFIPSHENPFFIFEEEGDGGVDARIIKKTKVVRV